LRLILFDFQADRIAFQADCPLIFVLMRLSCGPAPQAMTIPAIAHNVFDACQDDFKYSPNWNIFLLEKPELMRCFKR
jgi:hypothetical protein